MEVPALHRQWSRREDDRRAPVPLRGHQPCKVERADVQRASYGVVTVLSSEVTETDRCEHCRRDEDVRVNECGRERMARPESIPLTAKTALVVGACFWRPVAGSPERRGGVGPLPLAARRVPRDASARCPPRFVV